MYISFSISMRLSHIALLFPIASSLLLIIAFIVLPLNLSAFRRLFGLFFTVTILYHAMRDKSIGIVQKTHAMRDFVGVHKILQFVLYILFYKKQATELLSFPLWSYVHERYCSLFRYITCTYKVIKTPHRV